MFCFFYQSESQVILNSVDHLDNFLADIRGGRWDQVLPQLSNLKLTKNKLEDLYEQVVLELLELRESDTARAMLRQTQVFSGMQQDQPERYIALERLCTRAFIDTKELYKGTTREKRRTALAASISAEVAAVPPSRLMVLIGQALKWQQQQGAIPAGANFDLFRGTVAVEIEDEERHPTALDRTIRFGAKSHPECAVFSPNGQYLVSGSVDGFIEVWDHRTGKLRKDLAYQNEEKFMMHDTAVLCLAFSHDGELLASGSQDGMIKVWRLSTGQCLRRFDAAHTQGITSLSFSGDGSQVLSSSYDGLLRLHGIKSGRMLKEFRGHSSYVNYAVFAQDGAVVVSASSDATIRVWDLKSCECTAVLKPPQPTSSAEVAVLGIIPNPQNADQLIVCTKSPTGYLMTLQGQVIRSYIGKTSSADILSDYVACTCSPRGDFIYFLAESGWLHCFAAAHGNLVHKVQVAEKGPIGITHHPRMNVLASCSQDGVLKTWKAG